jgi:hypothetical protein
MDFASFIVIFVVCNPLANKGKTMTCENSMLQLSLRRGTLYPDELRGHSLEKGGMIAG